MIAYNVSRSSGFSYLYTWASSVFEHDFPLKVSFWIWVHSVFAAGIWDSVIRLSSPPCEDDGVIGLEFLTKGSLSEDRIEHGIPSDGLKSRWRAVGCLSFPHSSHLMGTLQSRLMCDVDAQQRKQILFSFKNLFRASRDLKRKALHLLRAWFELCRGHLVVGSDDGFSSDVPTNWVFNAEIPVFSCCLLEEKFLRTCSLVCGSYIKLGLFFVLLSFPMKSTNMKNGGYGTLCFSMYFTATSSTFPGGWQEVFEQ